MKQLHATVNLVKTQMKKAAWMIAWIGIDQSQFIPLDNTVLFCLQSQHLAWVIC